MLGVSSQEASAKFHTLRTQFNRESAREKKTKSGSSSNELYVSKWEYMSCLQFLRINTVISVTTSNLCDEICDEISSDVILSSESSDTQSEYSDASSSSNKKKRRIQIIGNNAKKKRYRER